MNRKGVVQLAINKAQTNLKNRQIATVFAIDQMSASFMDGTRSGGYRPDIQQNDGQGQTGQTLGVVQHGAFQIKTMPFQVTKHFFNPHSASISLKGQRSIRQIGHQTPGLVFASSPMHQQIDRIDFALCQPTHAQPAALPRLLHPTAKVMPIGFLRQTDMYRGFLSQNVVPTPLIQLFQPFHRPKFAIAHQQYGKTCRQQAANIAQQLQLGRSATMPAHMPHPHPSNRNGAPPIRQTDDQQLMRKAHFTAIHNQADLLPVLGLTFQPLSRNRFIPCPHDNRWISQQSAQAPCDTDQLRLSWDLPCHPAQVDRTTLINPDDQPDETANLGDPLVRAQFLDSLNPGMIQCVDRHETSPVGFSVVRTTYTAVSLPINSPFLKLSGG